MRRKREDNYLNKLNEELNLNISEDSEISSRIRSSGQISYDLGGKTKEAFFVKTHPFSWYIVVEVAKEDLD